MTNPLVDRIRLRGLLASHASKGQAWVAAWAAYRLSHHGISQSAIAHDFSVDRSRISRWQQAYWVYTYTREYLRVHHPERVIVLRNLRSGLSMKHFEVMGQAAHTYELGPLEVMDILVDAMFDQTSATELYALLRDREDPVDSYYREVQSLIAHAKRVGSGYKMHTGTRRQLSNLAVSLLEAILDESDPDYDTVQYWLAELEVLLPKEIS